MKKLLVLFLICCSLKTQLLASLPTQNARELKILSWNLYMLPGITNLSKQIEKSDKKERAKEIAEYLNQNQYDVIVFQEAFFNPSRKILCKLLKEVYPYQYGPANPSGLSLKTSSGVMVVSKEPLKVLGTVQYETCNGADCFAKKGAILLEGKFNDKPYQIMGTHLNAGGAQWIREEQYNKMKSLLNDFYKLNVPQIICGDMNTHMEDLEKYGKMLKTLDASDINTPGQQKNTTAKDRSVIDYILLRKNNTSLHATNKEVLWIKSKAPVIEKLNGNLSDHLAISAFFSWQ